MLDLGKYRGVIDVVLRRSVHEGRQRWVRGISACVVVALLAPLLAVIVSVVSPTAAFAEDTVPLPAITIMEQNPEDAVVACTHSDQVTSNLIYFPPTPVAGSAGSMTGYVYLPLVPDTENSTVTMKVKGVYTVEPSPVYAGNNLFLDRWNPGWGYGFGLHTVPESGEENTLTLNGITTALYRLRFEYDPDADRTVSGLWRVEVSGASISCPDILTWAADGGAPDYFGWAGDPVNTATGSFFHTEPLLSYPPHVFGMDSSLNFNSLDPTGSVVGAGTGWKSTWDASLELEAEDLFSGAPDPGVGHLASRVS